MDWGSNALSNIILPTSGKIGVLAINSFKTYAYFNISVQVFFFYIIYLNYYINYYLYIF